MECLPRAHIIRRRIVFETARLQGRRVSNRYMTLSQLPRESVQFGETGTVAFLTPKRLGPATLRNKVRRRMREIYRRHLARPDPISFLIWIARPPATQLPFEELQECMSALVVRMDGSSRV